MIDDEPDIEALFRQQFRRDLRAQRFVMDFAVSAADALMRIADPMEQTLILIISDINMPGITGLSAGPCRAGSRLPVLALFRHADPSCKRRL